MQELLNITSVIKYCSQILDVRPTSLPHICEHKGAKKTLMQREFKSKESEGEQKDE